MQNNTDILLKDFNKILLSLIFSIVIYHKYIFKYYKQYIFI